MSALFNTILYQPFFNGLIFLQQSITFGDLGLAIILLTIIVRIFLYPLSYKSFKSQIVMQKIQPEIKKIQEKHKNDKEKQAQLLMEVWKKNKVNPFSGFFLLLIQLPILIALYQIFLSDFSSEALSGLYSFVSRPDSISQTFLGLIDLRERSIVIVIVAAALQYLTGHLTMIHKGKGEKQDKASKMSRNMVLIGPVITIVFLTALPAAVGLYWATTAGFSAFQQVIIRKSLNSSNDGKRNDSGHNRKGT